VSWVGLPPPPPEAPRAPGPRRGVRVAIGLSAAGVLAAVALVALIIAGTSLPEGSADGRGTGGGDSAPARILDVDEYDSPYDNPWYDASANVDVEFDARPEHVVTTIPWPADRPVPAVGATVEVSYDPADPEYSTAVAGADWTTGEEPELPPPPAGALWTAAVVGLLAVAAVVATVIWARRVPVPPPPLPGWAWPPAAGPPPPRFPDAGAGPHF
jgi:hypothetical protein